MKIVVDTHTHTLASGHAYSTIQEMAIEAAKNNIEAFAVTDHGPAIKEHFFIPLWQSQGCAGNHK